MIKEAAKIRVPSTTCSASESGWLSLANVVAYLGRAHASRPYRIGNISVGGFCVLSDEVWTPGTEMPMTLQREEWDGDESAESITVQAIVVRRASGQTGFSIALSTEDSIALEEDDGKLWPSKEEMERFLINLRKPKTNRLHPPICIDQRPLSFAERSERLLELAKSHTVSTTSELLYTLGSDTGPRDRCEDTSSKEAESSQRL